MSKAERTVEVTIISDKYEPQNLGGLSSKIFVKDHTFANDYTGKIEIPSTVNYNNTEYRVTAISNFAFINCTDLTSIIIPEGVKSIGGGAFFGCISLKDFIIPSSVTTIEDEAFGECKELTTITIPKGVLKIGTMLFSGCDNLKSIIVEDGNPIYDSRENCNAIIETNKNILILI